MPDESPPSVTTTDQAGQTDLGDLELVEPSKQEQKRLLLAQRDQLDQTVWKNEVLAQRYEQAFVNVWDALLAQNELPSGDKYRVLTNVHFDRIRIGSAGPEEHLDFGVRRSPMNDNPAWLEKSRSDALLAKFARDYRIVQTEFHHARFTPDTGKGATSAISAVFYVDKLEPPARYMIQGTFHVRWHPLADETSLPRFKDIDATDFVILSRSGQLPYEEILTINHALPDTRAGVQPLLVRDLNDDGLNEIVLAGANEVLRNEGNARFRSERLCGHPEPVYEAGLLADLNGDGNIDLLVPGHRGDLLLYQGDQQGRFVDPPIGKARGGGPLRQPQVITAGDIDLDGDLDLWVAQYRISYLGGQMPTPYYDANDGFPAYLLLNDGTGRLQPATEEMGLAAKRFRRTYGSSFVDLDHDDDLDLLVVSDFAGVDIYHNDGTGYFTEVTNNVVDERHLFGMSATIADYDLDGQLDFFVTGMASTTARRLEFLKLGRTDQPQVHLMRSRMGYGNRMYLAQGEGRYAEPAFRDQVARTGWTWGATSLDFDNDGDQDIFVANGHSSGKSTKDHCSHFWCHDIYHNDSKPNEVVQSVFQEVLAGYQDRSESWDGYQKNALLMNTGGAGFTNIGFLLGVGQQYDGRAVVSDDIDNDGRVDLLVVEDRWSDGQILHVYRNVMESETKTKNHWIGVRLRESAGGPAPFGAVITVETAARTQVGVVVAGDSIHSQHPTRKHFGLGVEETVKSITVRWPGGKETRLQSPETDQYHDVTGPSAG